ncbi:Lipase, class 3 [Ostreococcus tauri]|nr:Lipase, class 3 [Ostreococcus tauri]CEF97538.1 Lipase, class 3 [Ostreococcus tauri]|eukprot:XP_003078723.2 Lipase, class 3 [Ostreococcus tauri]
MSLKRRYARASVSHFERHVSGLNSSYKDERDYGAATPPPRTWGESAVRLASVVRLSWKEALARLGIWRLDHVLAIRMLAERDMSATIAREVRAHGSRVELKGGQWRETMKELKMALRYSKSLRRAPDLKTVAKQGGVEKEAILLSDLAPALMRPAYVLFKDIEAERLILVVRGTHSAKDMITNLTGTSSPHHTMSGGDGKELRVGYAHSGFLTMARYLERVIKDDLVKALKSNPGYDMKLVGHSLGGGVAVLLTEMLLQDERFQSVGLHCYTFACPSTLSRELAESVRPFVTTCVNNSDLVAFVSFSKVNELQREVVSTALEQRLLDKWRQNAAAMSPTDVCGPTPSRFAAAAAAVGKQHYGPEKYPGWLRALRGLKDRHNKLVESSSLYRQSLLIGKTVSKTSSKLVSLSGAFIAGVVSPRPRKKDDVNEMKVARPVQENTAFKRTNQQVGDTISQAVLATDICNDAHLAHVHADAPETTAEEKNFEEYIKIARIALDEDFQKPLTAADVAKIYKAEANAAQEVLRIQADISVVKAAELLADEEATMLADYYGTDLPQLYAGSHTSSERDPVVKRRCVSMEESARHNLEETDKRDTEKLYPAGRILHFVLKSGLDEESTRTAVGPSAKPDDQGRFDSRRSLHALFDDVDLDVYSRIILSRTMIADHFLAQYEDIIDGFIAEIDASTD